MSDYRAENVVASGVDWLKRNTGLVAVVLGLGAILGVVLIYGEVTRRRDETQAMMLYENLSVSPETRLQELARLASQYAQTSVGARAKLDYAKELYRLGQYESAESEYASVLKRENERSLYGQRAKLGLAYCAEQEGDYEKARRLYGEIREQEGVYAAEAARMLKKLENPPEIPRALGTPGGTVPPVPVESPPGAPEAED